VIGGGCLLIMRRWTAMMRDEFRRRLSQAQSEFVWGLKFYHIARAIFHAHIDRKLDRFYGFFVPVHRALDGMVTIQFAKVFDKNPKDASLRNLLCAAKKGASTLVPYGTERQLDEMCKQLGRQEKAFEELKAVRNKYIAHSDAQRPKLPTLAPSDFDTLVDSIKSLFDCLSLMHDQSTHNWPSPDVTSDTSCLHTDEILRLLREDR